MAFTVLVVSNPSEFRPAPLTISLGLNAHQLRYVMDRSGMSYSSSVFSPHQPQLKRTSCAHMLSIRVLSEVVGCVFVAVIFLKIETAQAPEGVEVILETSFVHNPLGASGLPVARTDCTQANRARCRTSSISLTLQRGPSINPIPNSPSSPDASKRASR